MAGTVIVTKYSLATGSPATDALAVGEQAYSFASDKLFIGETSGGDVVARVIGGQHFTDMLDHTAGTLTASSAIIVDANSKIDVLNVDNLTLNGNAITSTNTNGDITITPNGSGAVILDGLSHPTSDGSAGMVLTTDGSGNLSFSAPASSSLTLSADSGTNDNFNTGETLTFTGGNGIDTTVTDNVITFAAEVATSSNQGVATFATADFDVTSGDVTVKALGISNAQLAGSIANGKLANTTVAYGGVTLALGTADTTPAFDLSDATAYPTSSLVGTITNAQLAGSIANGKLANSTITIGSDSQALGTTITDLNGITSLDVDNVTIDGNAISTSDSNGNLSLAPNGTGVVTVPSGYEGRAGFSADALVNKSYVDSVANGLDVKASVRVATTGNLSATYNNGAGTLTSSANGAISIDSVTLTTNDRVLVKDQSSGFQNGFYKVTQIGDAGNPYILTRTPDADAASELTSGAFTFSEEGTTNGDNGYVMSTNGAITLGTTAITFDQFSGAGQISAGNGLTKSGNTINTVGTADRISVTADAIDIASGYVGQTSITTTGTIATGTWEATDVAVAHGGTGLSSFTANGILLANGAGSALDFETGTQYQVLGFNASGVPTATGTIDGGTF
tara:strand:+ start:1568 stop:3439 length:1872 start_codon:yes stop_codon:yes gene_type:complete